MSDVELRSYIESLPQRYHVGITGTRHIPTRDQIAGIAQVLEELYCAHIGTGGVYFFHHGDCTGVDVTGARYAERLGYITVAHPPVNPKWRAFHRSTVVMGCQDYRTRNFDIVRRVGVLLVAPRKPEQEDPRSETWMTCRMASQLGKRRIIIWPDGRRITEE